MPAGGAPVLRVPGRARGHTGRGAARQAGHGQGSRRAGWQRKQFGPGQGIRASPQPINSQAKNSLDSSALPFYSQRDRASQAGEEGGLHLHGHRGKAPRGHCGHPIFRERPTKATLPSFSHPFTQQVFRDPMSVPGSMLGTGDTAVSKTKPVPKVWGQRQHTRGARLQGGRRRRRRRGPSVVRAPGPVGSLRLPFY